MQGSLSFVTKSGQRNKGKENLSDPAEGLLSKTQHGISTRKQIRNVSTGLEDVGCISQAEAEDKLSCHLNL